ncbi:sensor histidine kinase [Ketobacter sp.]|uniref:sensor histidine kinase n=1 Tax=Ketobacter sp. TaxID=2083498 RepID=UPI000F172BF6|nr:HAMP domain-containing sensor histidine kinase [Ketobacter sp.]RLU00661.1 MAG: sensor histidine kinase [Ketobacter sp.]
MPKPRAHPFRHWSIGRLRWVLGISFILLVIPTIVLSLKARQQIKWEALYQQRQLAEELARSIDGALQRWLRTELQRAADEYQYLLDQKQAGATRYLQRSPLSQTPQSQWPDGDAAPGLLGYFQVNSEGQLSTPLLPDSETEGLSSGLTREDLQQRQLVKQRIESVLGENHLVAPSDSDAPAPQQAVPPASAAALYSQTYQSQGSNSQTPFDQLNQKQDASRQAKTLSKRSNLGNIAELELERAFADQESDAVPAQRARKKALAEETKTESLSEPLSANADLAEAVPSATPITLFNNTTSNFNLALLESGHLILFRNAWVNNQRLIQGLLIDQQAFIQAAIQQAFEQSRLSDTTNLVIAYQGTVLKILSSEQYRRRTLNYTSLAAQDVKGTLLLQSALSGPLAELELVFSVNRLPDGPGGTIITWASLLLLGLLCVIFALLHHFGVRQIRLLQQQQNFIASVSHELKTPLTSIRMFSEMLREGWAPAEKQQEYFSFISDESERLSRLINNVLQLARMERQELQLDIKPVSVTQVIDLLRSRLQSQVAATPFSLNLHTQAITGQTQLALDMDAMMQIMMNLVDNSLKFCKHAAHKSIDLTVRQQRQEVIFEIRDYGPGIAAAEQHRIFDLFYRIGDELTRSAQGTGIGLALVQQLVQEMGGRITYYQPEQGAGFRLSFPCLAAHPMP